MNSRQKTVTISAGKNLRRNLHSKLKALSLLEDVLFSKKQIVAYNWTVIKIYNRKVWQISFFYTRFVAVDRLIHN